METSPSKTSTKGSQSKKWYVGHRKRMRDRYLKAPERTFSDSEILELMLYNVVPRTDTKPLAKMLLSHCASLLGLLNAPEHELKKLTGVGEALVFQLKLMHDFFSRLHIPIDVGFNVISNWNSVINYCQLNLAFKKVEYFRALFLNSKNILIGDEICQSGTVDRVEIYPREIAKKALECSAAAIILVHNHPSGDPYPSKEDIELTDSIVKALESLGIVVYDHIIIAEYKHFSFKGNGILK